MKPQIDTLDLALISRLRAIVAGERATESEVRKLADLTGGWVRSVEAQLAASESRLAQLGSDPASDFSAIATEVRRRDGLAAELADARVLLEGLDARARELRTAWLKRHAESRRPDAV